MKEELNNLYLEKLILEELESYISEVALCHDPKTGHFDSCDSGNVYSLSARGAKDNKIDGKYVQRGTLTGKKDKGDVPKVSSKFGLNTSDKKQGGRIKMRSGDGISPKYYVSKYPEKYKENIIKEFQTALQDWLSKQKNFEYQLMDEGDVDGCDCREEKRKAYQDGIKSSLIFIQKYSQAQKGDV